MAVIWDILLDRKTIQVCTVGKYKLHFDLLHRRIKHYNVAPSNTYNVDEKGFLIGVIDRSERVFSRRQWEKKEVKAVAQDGSSE